MTTPAAMQAEYTDMKFIRTRKTLQIILELPIEAAGAFVAAFGTPDPSKSVPVAIARLVPGAPEPAKPKGGKLAQQAGILCGEEAFMRFLTERYPTRKWEGFTAADCLRDYCDVTSRAELDINADAATKFKMLRAEYNAWLSHG